MKIKTLIVAALLSLGFPLTAKAESTPKQDSCFGQCAQLLVSQTNDLATENDTEVNETAQRTRPRRVRTRSRNDFRKFYVGGTLGLFFPSTFEDFPEILSEDGEFESVDFGTGFGGNLYGGYKFSKLISADLEFLLFGGGADPLDTDYGSFGVFLNPRFTYSLNQDDINKSPYAYLSPGLGVVGVGFSDGVEDVLDAIGVDESGAGFALQIKGGVGYPFSDLIDIFGQVRYFTAFNVFSEDDFPDTVEADDQSFSSLGLELGVNFKF